LTLAECKAGEKVKVVALHMNQREQRRFMELGILPGTEIEMIRTAPFKDPISVKVRGFQVSLRKKHAEKITISHGGCTRS